MYSNLSGDLAAERIWDLRRRTAKARLVRDLRSQRRRDARGRRVGGRLLVLRPRRTVT